MLLIVHDGLYMELCRVAHRHRILIRKYSGPAHLSWTERRRGRHPAVTLAQHARRQQNHPTLGGAAERSSEIDTRVGQCSNRLSAVDLSPRLLRRFRATPAVHHSPPMALPTAARRLGCNPKHCELARCCQLRSIWRIPCGRNRAWKICSLFRSCLNYSTFCVA